MMDPDQYEPESVREVRRWRRQAFEKYRRMSSQERLERARELAAKLGLKLIEHHDQVTAGDPTDPA